MMKKRILCFVLSAVTVMASAFLVGCSGKSCLNCMNVKCREGIACGLECSAEYYDCSAVVCDAFMGESCTDALCVVPCYKCAGELRTSDGIINLKSNLQELSEDDYVVTTYHSQKAVAHVQRYYKLTLRMQVKANVDLSDVVVNFDISDNNGNKQSDINLYVASYIKAGDYNTKTAEMVFTFYLPEGGENPYMEDGYEVDVKINSVWGR